MVCQRYYCTTVYYAVKVHAVIAGLLNKKYIMHVP